MHFYISGWNQSIDISEFKVELHWWVEGPLPPPAKLGLVEGLINERGLKEELCSHFGKRQHE